MENRPIRAQVVLMPSYKEACPNMNRWAPSMGSMPMVDSSRPSAPEIRPFSRDLDATPAIMVRPKIESQKYSGDPNFMASCASSGAKKYKETQESRPPQKDEKQATASALPAFPCKVSW